MAVRRETPACCRNGFRSAFMVHLLSKSYIVEHFTCELPLRQHYRNLKANPHLFLSTILYKSPQFWLSQDFLNDSWLECIRQLFFETIFLEKQLFIVQTK